MPYALKCSCETMGSLCIGTAVNSAHSMIHQARALLLPEPRSKAHISQRLRLLKQGTSGTLKTILGNDHGSCSTSSALKKPGNSASTGLSVLIILSAMSEASGEVSGGIYQVTRICHHSFE